MKTYLFLLNLFCISLLFGQQTAVTKDGKTVVLNDNGTWQYVVNFDAVTMPDSALKKYIKPQSAKTFLKSSKVNHGIWYTEQKWLLMDIKVSDASEYLLKLKGEDGYCVTVTEKIKIPLESFKEIVSTNLKAKGAESIDFEKEEYRIVNGQKILYMRFRATAKGIDFTYSGYYFSDNSGTTQMLCYTGSNLFQQYSADFENLLNGFIITEKEK